MANEIKRSFGRANKAKLSSCNPKGEACPRVNTEFALTGKFDVQDGWLDRRTGEMRDTDRSYAFFEGKRNGTDVAAGISAGVFLRRPFDGFTEEEAKELTDFQKALIDCANAGDLDEVFEKNGVYDGKTVFVKSVVRHSEIPYGKNEARPVSYAIFDLK